MATITSAASGNFSAGATWVGGVVPGAADIAVAATGHVITIDVDVTVTEFRQTGTGKFSLGGGRTITGAVTGTGGTATTGGTVEYIGTTTATINGNITNTNSAANGTAVLVSGSGTLSINGNLTCTTGTGAAVLSAVRVNTTGGMVTITGTLTGAPLGSGFAATCLHLSASRTVNVVGTLIGQTANSGIGRPVLIDNGTVNLTGTIIGPTGTNAEVVRVSGSSAMFNLTGNVTGGAANDALGIVADGASATVTVIGDATAGTGQRSHAISSSSTANGVVLTGNIIDTQTGTTAIYARLFRLGATNSGYTRYANSTGFPSGGVVSRVSPDKVTGMPAAGNVRDATVYGFNSELTGTLRVPPANSVASGVPVDNTTGTAALSPADVAALVGAQIAAALDSVP